MLGPIEFFLFKFLYVCVCFAYMYICTTYMPGVLRGQERALDPLELELVPAVSCHLGARN